MKDFKTHFKRDVSRLASLTLTLAFAFHAFAGVGVTKKQLEKTVDGINSNMSQMVSAEIGRNVDSYVDEITLRAIAGATNFLPSFIEGLGQFAEASRFSLLEFDENSLVFDDSYMSNGVFVSRSHKAYFKASWVSPTNKGFRVESSSYPGIPAGTVFAIDEVPVAQTNHPMRVEGGTLNPINNGRLVWSKYQLHNADLFSKPLELLWCEWRWDIGVVETNRVISENGLYDAKISISRHSAGIYDTYEMEVKRTEELTSPNWVKPPSGEAHIVTLADIDGIFRMAVVSSLETDGYILGTFTLMPTCLTDAEAHTARNGTPKVSTLSRLWRSVKALFVPDAVADRQCTVFGSDIGIPTFCITWTTAQGEELGTVTLPVSLMPPKKRVNDKGMEHDTDVMYLPSTWYTLADWCKVENWISFPTSYTIYYANSLGQYETENGTKYSASTRQMNLSTFKALFLDHAGSLKALYVYPRRIEKKDPCKEGRHSYVHCVCSVCGHTREHNFIKYGDCYRCGYEESKYTVDENNEIVEEPGSRSACGFVPKDQEYHGGWHGVGEIIDDQGNRRFCGCTCGHYSDNNERYFPLGYEGERKGSGLIHLTLDHLFDTNTKDVAWEPGDENGNDTETQHHATLYCLRETVSDKTCAYVVEGHKFYSDDGTYNCYVKGHEDEEAAENYHLVVGVCLKCSGEVETVDLHRKELAEAGETGSCVCVGGVHFPDTPGCGEIHHMFVWTPCGEYRCLYCLSFSDDNIRIPESDHMGPQPPGTAAGDRLIMNGYEINHNNMEASMWGTVLRAGVPDENGHWCGCGMVQIKHSFVEDPETHDQVCVCLGDGSVWWKEIGCGWTKHVPQEDGEFNTTVTVNDVRGGSDHSLRGRTYSISSFSWNPSKGEQPPLPSEIWGHGKGAPTRLPPLDDEDAELSPTVVDFTFLTEISLEWTSDWVWRNGNWEKKRNSFWDVLNWWLRNTPIIFR